MSVVLDDVELSAMTLNTDTYTSRTRYLILTLLVTQSIRTRKDYRKVH